MSQSPGATSNSLFRTRAWVQTWVDVWGDSPRIKLIDLGGRGDALEMMYLITHRLKGVLPIKSLVIAGYGHADFSPPRGEYNSLDSFIRLYGGIDALAKDLIKLPWNQWVLTDFTEGEVVPVIRGSRTIMSRSETAYYIRPIDFESYKKQLSPSIRAKYFNRRAKTGRTRKRGA